MTWPFDSVCDVDLECGLSRDCQIVAYLIALS